jgi:hypothetical protein
MITKPATEKQIQFRNKLVDEALARIASRLNEPGNGHIAGELVARAAFVIALPAPASSAEASEQIDALQQGASTITSYARRHQAWAEAVMAQAMARLGEDASQWPARIERDPRFVTEYAPGGVVRRVQDGEHVTAASLRRTFA